MRAPQRLHGGLARCAAAALALLAAAGCASHDPRDPNTLVILEAADAGQIEPLLTSQYYSFLYQNLIFDVLVGTGKDYAPVPQLATSWHANKAGTVWTLELRHNARWSDGQPVTSADVVWTYEALIDPKTGSPYQGQDAYVKDVVALGPYRVRIDLKQPNATFMNSVLQSQWIMPEHLFRGVSHAQIRTTNFGENPVGSGPYKLVRWNHDQECLMAANPYWWGGTPRVKAVDVRIVLNPQAGLDAMLQGTGDVIDGLGPETQRRLREDPNLSVMSIPDLYTAFIYLNYHVKGLDDVAVRRAMLYGWDRDGVTRGLEHASVTVANGVEPAALTYWHNDKVKPYPYDPSRARALLDAAGWRPGRDGIRRKGNVRLAFELKEPGGGGGGIGQDIAAEFQADMRAVGIEIDNHLLDYATFIDQLQSSNFQLAYSGWGGSPDPDQYTLLDSSQIPPNGNNVGFYRNPAVDRDLRQGLKALDDAKRKTYYDDMQVRVAADVPLLFLYNQTDTVGVNRRVHITGPLMPGLYLFTNVMQWRLDP